MNKIFIIAEAGVNHNGDLDRALDMVDVAAKAGADAIKFQTFKAENLVTAKSPKAAYQQQTTGSGSQLEMLKALELNETDHFTLAQRCQEQKIEFLSTPFDHQSLHFLIDNHLIQRVKIPSGELTNGPLLLEAALTKKPLIVSTGMAHPEEIDLALRVLSLGYSGKHPSAYPSLSDPAISLTPLIGHVTLLHCTTAYPTPFVDVNINAMVTLRKYFGMDVGYSDHTEGIAITIAAAALGATVVEKHFTLNRNLKGPDHSASIEPNELAALVASIRAIEQALGDGNKRPLDSELANTKVARKSLVAAIPITKGTPFSTDNVTCKRPGGGRSPMDYWNLLGTLAQRNYQPDEFID